MLCNCRVDDSMQQVLLLREQLAAWLSSVFVDNHNEPDVGLKRSRPLHLSAERYQKLTEMVLRHQVSLVDGQASHGHVANDACFLSIGQVGKQVLSIRSTSDRVIIRGWY